MAHLIVLFNLKDANRREDYERWAREVDLPTAGALPSVDRFELLRSSGLLGGAPSPYEYIEVLKINDMAQLGRDAATPAMQAISAQLNDFADAPLFIVAEAL